MTQRIVLLVLFALIGTSCDTGGPIGITMDADYLPLAAGNEWVYQTASVADGGTEVGSITVLLDPPVVYDSVAWYSFNNWCVAKTTFSQLPLFCAAWGKKSSQVLSFRYGPGPAPAEYDVVLDFPLWKGKSWQTRKGVDTSFVTSSGDTVIIQRSSVRTIEGTATVVVPADTFQLCVRVLDVESDRYEYRRAGGTTDGYVAQRRSTEWFAPNVGMVQQIVAVFSGDSLALQGTEIRKLERYTRKGP